MKYYSYSVSRKKLPYKILLIFAFVLLVIAAAILLGNYLKNKTDALGDEDQMNENAVDGTDLSVEQTNAVQGELSGEDALLELGEKKISVTANVKGACVEIIRLNGGMNETVMNGQLKSLPSDGFNTVSVPLTTADGVLLYRSDAVHQVLREESSESGDVQSLKKFVSEAHSLLMRVSGVYVLPKMEDALMFEAALACDALIWRELSDTVGLDEIVLVVRENDPESIFDRIVAVVRTMREATPTLACGIAFEGEAFDSLESAQILEKISGIVDFLALNLSDRVEVAVKNSGDAYETANSVIQNLRGSISFYDLRILLSGYDQPIRDGQTGALAANSVGNYQFVSAGAEDAEK